MKVLCVYPAFPRTYWGHEYSLRLVGKQALLPPLGLLTVAALLPQNWQVRLADLNLRPLRDAELSWADVVFLSGMLVQRPALLEIAARARAAGKIVVIGGPVATAGAEQLSAYADCVVVGEAEEIMAPLAAALETGRAALPPRMVGSTRPNVRLLRPPRYDLLEIQKYHSLSVQWSRGCPFNCEFCDIIEVFGRQQRTKSPEQLCRELDAILATGFRGPVFLSDDNLVGNKAEALGMLAALRDWMRAHDFPFQFYGEASINLAASDQLMSAMVAAGFDAVFVGIETPSEEALRETHKTQNLAMDLHRAVQKLTRHGLEISAGFIVGFDSDDVATLQRQREWIALSCIPEAMVGILNALPNTQLERRLVSEGRLTGPSSGETFGRPNFRTRMDEVELLEGYAALLADIYRPEAYFARAARALALCPHPSVPFAMPWRHALRCFFSSLYHQGVRGNYRREYWRFLHQVLREAPRRLTRAIGQAIAAEHLIRYTREDVLPRLQKAILQAKADRGSKSREAA